MVVYCDNQGRYRLKNLTKTASGHRMVTLTGITNRSVNLIRLMAETFLGPPPSAAHRWVCPIDGNIDHVHPLNLRWSNVCPGRGAKRFRKSSREKTNIAADVSALGLDEAAKKHGLPISYVRHIRRGAAYSDRDRSSPAVVSTAQHTPPSSNDEWRQIPGCPGYDVSAEGRLRSWRGLRVKELQPQLGTTGYLGITLSLGAKGRYIVKQVHRIVAEAFCPRSSDQPCINHVDGNKINNHWSNLEWTSHADNIQHAHRAGLWSQGPSHGRRWLRPPPELYPAIRAGSIDTQSWHVDVVAALRSGFGWADQSPTALEKEEWRALLSRGPVEVSSRGRVRVNRLLLQSLSTHGYPVVRLYIGDGRSRMVKTHHLVAEAFLGQRPGQRFVVNHKDLNKQNNDASNLEWVTYRENSKHWAALRRTL
jgi:hypothetical protein